MCATVDSQGASLNEAFPTIKHQAGVWSFIGMNAIMSLKVGLSTEGLTVDVCVSYSYWTRLEGGGESDKQRECVSGTNLGTSHWPNATIRFIVRRCTVVLSLL